MSDKLINVILDDAQRIATSTRNEGSEKAQEIITNASSNVSVSKQKAYEESILIRENILKQAIVDANLEVKKLILSTKREIIDSAFSKAMEKLLNLPKQDYLNLISSLLNNCDDGDTVFISLKDKMLLQKFYRQRIKKLGKKLVLSNQYINILEALYFQMKNLIKILVLSVNVKY